MAPIGNIRLPEGFAANSIFARPASPMAAEKGEAEVARTPGDIERILACPGPRGQACSLGLPRGPGEEADALQRAAREFYLGAMEDKRRRRWRRLAVCAVVAVVGFGVWWAWCAWR
jgi:hypothetical protein